jgi:hypothetical protein
MLLQMNELGSSPRPVIVVAATNCSLDRLVTLYRHAAASPHTHTHTHTHTIKLTHSKVSLCFPLSLSLSLSLSLCVCVCVCPGGEDGCGLV